MLYCRGQRFFRIRRTKTKGYDSDRIFTNMKINAVTQVFLLVKKKLELRHFNAFMTVHFVR